MAGRSTRLRAGGRLPAGRKGEGLCCSVSLGVTGQATTRKGPDVGQPGWGRPGVAAPPSAPSPGAGKRQFKKWEGAVPSLYRIGFEIEFVSL